MNDVYDCLPGETTLFCPRMILVSHAINESKKKICKKLYRRAVLFITLHKHKIPHQFKTFKTRYVNGCLNSRNVFTHVEQYQK